MNDHNKIVTATMLAAVETGGQVYGQARWDDYTAPMTNSSKEYTCTIGAYAFYGDEAEQLIQMIFDKGRATFDSIDDGRIQEMLNVNWVSIRWWPSDADVAALKSLISSSIGIECQKALMSEIRLPKYITRAVEFGVTGEAAQMMWCEIQHLGGLGPTQRVFKRCLGDYSLDSIMSALAEDQQDPRYADNGVGSKKYWSRHVVCRDIIEKHADTSDVGASPVKADNGVYLRIGG